MVPTRIRGSSEAYGSWNMIWKSRRLRLRSPWFSLVTSFPSKRIAPEVGFSSATTSRPIVVLPQPDSPTRPNVSPSRTEKDTLETALTLPTLRCRTAPAVTGNSFTSWSTSTITLRDVSSSTRPNACLDASAESTTRIARLGAEALPTGLKQATRWPDWSSNGGSSTRHRSVALRHRGSNLQPTNSPLRSGGVPGMLYSGTLASASILGMESSSASE